MDGKLRYVPDQNTFEKLFGSSEELEELTLPQVESGEPLSSGAVLARAIDSSKEYLVSNGVKRHITSDAVKEKYHFIGQVDVVAAVLLNYIPEGDPIPKA